MITTCELSIYINTLLACNNYADYAPNGLQIAGRQLIKRICTAVTASYDVIEKAYAFEADALLVHHGYFWKGESPLITGMKHKRIAALIRHNMNLFAYHLPLDCHLELGNNAQIADKLALHSITSLDIKSTPNLLWTGYFNHPKPIADITYLLTNIFNRTPLAVISSPKPIHYLAWCSGAAQDLIEQAHDLGVDAYISGEISERTYYQAHELGLNYFACGHHATERYGIKALGEHLAQYANLSHMFIDSDNPV